MKKSLIALAALAATGAFAQSSVTLSGRASLDFSTYEAKGSTAGAPSDLTNRSRIADSGSRITFAVTEDLGGGLRAGVMCETGINIDNGSPNGQNDAGNANTTTWCSREGRISIGNNTAELRLGRQNVWWTQGELNQTGSTFVGSDTVTNLINGGVGVYTVRGENQIKLVGGRGMGAFAGSEVYYGFMGISGNTTAATNVTNTRGEAGTTVSDAKYYGFKVQYSAGQFLAMWDHQSSTRSAALAQSTTADSGSVGANSFDRSANKLGLGFRYTPTSMVAVQYWEKSRKDKTNPSAAFVSPFSAGVAAANVTTAGDAKDSGIAVVVKHDLGGGLMAHAQYAKANDIKARGVTQAATGATAYTLGVTKNLSKRTHVFGAYHAITNERNAAYNMTGGNYQGGTSRAGADIKMMALGMIHNF